MNADDIIRNIDGIKSKRKAKQYLHTAKVLSRFPLDISKLNLFKNSLKEVLLKEETIRNAIAGLSNKRIPVNKYTLLYMIKGKRVFNGNVSTLTTANAILKLLKETGAIYSRKIPVLLQSDGELLYEYLLSKGVVKFGELDKKFRDARELVLKLWLDKKVDIEGLDIAPDHIKNPDDIPIKSIPMNARKSPFITIWYDRIAKREYATITIPSGTRVMIKW